MTWHFSPMTDPEAVEIAAWRYGEPYTVHEWARDPGLRDRLVRAESRAKLKDFFTVRSEGGTLAGFFGFSRTGDGAIEIGLGLRPDLAGRGLGLGFVQAGLAFARTRYGGAGPLRLELQVPADNVRARKVYERAGFRATGEQLMLAGGELRSFVGMVTELA